MSQSVSPGHMFHTNVSNDSWPHDVGPNQLYIKYDQGERKNNSFEWHTRTY